MKKLTLPRSFMLACAALLAASSPAAAQETEQPRFTPLVASLEKPGYVAFDERLLRTLRVPPGFTVNVFARPQGDARVMAINTDGTVYLTRQEQGDVLLLREGKLTVNLSREENEAKLAVKDTGQGIDPGFLGHIFEMFRQGDVGTTRKHGGMGIGLALVRQLVELHGGRVEAHSEGVGLGASFSVWLPLDAAAPEAARLPAAREAASGRLASLRILVVDDTPDTVDVLQDMLELEGALVTTASSGAEALEIAGAAGFDLILSDVSMPEMDGYQLLEELRKGGRSAGVPAIALTGLGRPEDVERARAIGFTTHLTKPVTLDKLIKVARAAARQDVRPKISTSIKSSQG